MLIVQFGHLHMHNHELQESSSPKVHVLGGHAHQVQHDQSGEIDLQFDSMIAKIKIAPDLLPLILFVSLVLTLLTHRILRNELTVNFHKAVVFSLRPPSRASP